MLTISVVSFYWIFGFFLNKVLPKTFIASEPPFILPHTSKGKARIQKLLQGALISCTYCHHLQRPHPTKCVWQSLNFLSALFQEVPPATPWGQVVVGMRARFVKRTMTFVYLFLFFLCAWPFVCWHFSPFWKENRQTVVKWRMKVLHNNILPLIRLPPRATLDVAT